jgi:hypothetical protein
MKFHEDGIDWTERDMKEFEADFEMAVDMFEHVVSEKGKCLPCKDTDNVLTRFKESDYISANSLYREA